MGSPDIDEVRFVINPSAGRERSRRHLRRVSEAVDALGGSLYVSESAADLTAFAQAAVNHGVGRLVAVGGDGTFHHVIQGLAGSACELGLVPLGRGNDLTSSLGVPMDWRAALVLAVEGPARSIDLGRANGYYYAIYCGVGFDSEAGRIANSQTFLSGSLAYPYGVLRTLVSFKAPTFAVEHDRGSFEGRALLVNVANCDRLGGGMKLTPDASLDDGHLDLVLVHEIPRRTILRVFPKVYSGTHVDHPAIEIVRTRKARIELDQPLEVNADGERLFHADGPLEIEVVEAGLRVVSGAAVDS